MHISTIGLLTILLPTIAVGAILESKSWKDFESMMTKGGTYCLLLVWKIHLNENLDFLKVPCDKYPSVKCFYGLEGATTQESTSFDLHFNNIAIPAFAFFKDGKQVKMFDRKTSIYETEIEAEMKALQ
ncbi:uncharacterized protein LOC120353006 [Nilaparvata lugens]|uniref:uncharacterized protein LOC120353006 n=1 Tax=Nilaparvata lugens TaxID=108931 RepID=UPI00193DF7E5|nr:uncharacterized protein LOC120353006 [Nilaparvata lugens]